MDFTLGPLDVEHVMQDTMAEDQVKLVVGEWQVEHAALPADTRSADPQRQPGPDPGHRLGGQVDPGPAGPEADQPLGLGTLTQPDLEHLLIRHVQRIDTGRQVALVPVTEPVVIGEELLVVVVEPS